MRTSDGDFASCEQVIGELTGALDAVLASRASFTRKLHDLSAAFIRVNAPVVDVPRDFCTRETFASASRIETDGNGRYAFRSITPFGYGCPPEGTTQELLDQLGRRGQRPAHIHVFVEAPGYRKLTTQITIAGDRYLHEASASATRDELIVEARRETAPEEIARRGPGGPFSTLTFDFTLNREADHLPDPVVLRAHATAA